MSREQSKGRVPKPKPEEISRDYRDLLAQLPPKKPPADQVKQAGSRRHHQRRHQ